MGIEQNSADFIVSLVCFTICWNVGQNMLASYISANPLQSKQKVVEAASGSRMPMRYIISVLFGAKKEESVLAWHAHFLFIAVFDPLLFFGCYVLHSLH